MSFTFTTARRTTTTMPPDRRAEINIGGTEYEPVGGTTAFTSTVAPSTDTSKFFNITLARNIIFDIVVAPERTNYPYLNRARIVIPDATVRWNSTSNVTTFIVRFLDPFATTTTTMGNGFDFTTQSSTTTTSTTSTTEPTTESVTTDPSNTEESTTTTSTTTTTTTTTTATTTTTVVPRSINDVPSSLEIAWWFRNHVFKTTVNAMNPPYGLVPPAYFYEIPPETPVPVTQEIYTPVPTIDEDNTNITSFFTENAANAEIIAIVVSVVLGSIFLVTGVLAFKSWYDGKQLRERPSGMKYHKGSGNV